MLVRMVVVSGSEPPRAVAIEASSVADAIQRVRRDGGSVLSAHAATLASRISIASRASTLDDRVFCAQLAVLLRAGLGLVESLRALRDNARARSGREELDVILGKLESGNTLGSAIAALPSVFPPLLAAMVGSAERSSNLPDALERYGRHAAQIDALRATVRSAAVYPAFLVALGLAVIAFLLLYVVPRFSAVYGSVRGELPWAASLLLAWGRFVKEYGAWVTAGTAALAIAAAIALSSPQIRRTLSDAVLTLPTVGRLAHEMRLARLYRTLSVLLGAGITLHPALRDVPGLIAGDPDGALSRAAHLVSEGRSASYALEQAGLTTPLARSLIASGEGGGQLARMLDEAARFLELDTTRTLERAMKLIEPALMAAIGIAVGVIVVLMYLPIFELAGSLR